MNELGKSITEEHKIIVNMICRHVDSKVIADIKAWLDHHSLLLVAQIKLTLKYLSIRYILQITRHGIISTNFYLFKPPACSIFQDGGICKFVNRMSGFRLKSLIRLTTYLQIT